MLRHLDSAPQTDELGGSTKYQITTAKVGLEAGIRIVLSAPDPLEHIYVVIRSPTLTILSRTEAMHLFAQTQGYR